MSLSLDVTLFTGVWIEIFIGIRTCNDKLVTLFTGVWIEILFISSSHGTNTRHTLHGCVD